MMQRTGHPIRRRIGSPADAALSSAPREEGDLKLFVVSFTAFFVCFYTFLL